MEKKNNNERILIIVVSALVVILIGEAVWLGFFKPKSNNNMDNTHNNNNSEEVIQKYDLYNKIENGLLVNVDSNSKNIFNYYVGCDDLCDENDMSKLYVNNKNELIFTDDDGQKYKLADNVKSVNAFDEIYETLDGEKYLLTGDNSAEKIAAININKIYGMVEDIYLINDASVAENVAKYNGNNIIAKNVYYGVSFDFNSSFMDETATTIYVTTLDNNILYLEDAESGWKSTNVKANQLLYDNESGRYGLKAKYTKILLEKIY